MSARNLITIFTLIALVVGAIVGDMYYRSTAAAPDGRALLAEHDQLLVLDDEQPGGLTPDQAARLDQLHTEARPHLRARSFSKFAGFIGSDIFMALLKMLIMPLIISSVIVGVTSAGNFAKLGKLAGGTIFYFFTTMLLAVILGITLVSIIQPGKGFFDGPGGEQARITALEQGLQKQRAMMERQGASGIETPKTTADALISIVKRMIPSNIFAALAAGEALPVIVFSIFFGVILSMVGPPGEPIIAFARGTMDVMIRMVELVIYLVPIGVFFLVARSTMSIGLATFADKIGRYMFTVIAALLIHGFIVLPLILWAIGKTNPFKYFLAMKDALLLAFSSASSSATLPVTIDCARTKGGCSRKASGFILPLGSTINMDGTALYEAVAVIFLAQAFHGAGLPMEDKIIMAITATLAAIGAAGIPEAGLTTMIIVITTVNAGGVVFIPPAAIGLILGVDRILDMTRTMINVWGDAAGAKIMSRWAVDDEEPLTEAT